MIGNVTNFIKEVRQEASKVTWPTRKDTMLSVVMVLIMVTVVGAFFFVADIIISKIVTLILGI